MLRVTDAAPISITVPAADEMGVPITATAANWSLLDDDGVELTTGVAALSPEGAKVDLAGALNVIATLRASRCLRMVFATNTGPVTVDTYYIIAKASLLEVLVNSFQTLGQSLVLRESFGGLLEGWDVATNQERVSAMEHAFHKIARLGFRVYPDNAKSYAGWDEDSGYGVAYLISDIGNLPPEQFATLDPRFRKALVRAQLIEADNLLGGDVVGKRRRDGIMSETAGESSMMFNSRPALDLPLSREANRELARYIYRRVGIARG